MYIHCNNSMGSSCLRLVKRISGTSSLGQVSGLYWFFFEISFIYGYNECKKNNNICGPIKSSLETNEMTLLEKIIIILLNNTVTYVAQVMQFRYTGYLALHSTRFPVCLLRTVCLDIWSNKCSGTQSLCNNPDRKIVKSVGNKTIVLNNDSCYQLSLITLYIVFIHRFQVRRTFLKPLHLVSRSRLFLFLL
ncbi:hypothetical protein AGLY_010516 [Aphis glycines]|uniref:Uncharacterized protein n=1 Tax=Aphis glycines TaxID=307491 RepID=A0A6G0TF40_APHGL|nr:hypothetical protein AGLY_010516 [Aphis glycines]